MNFHSTVEGATPHARVFAKEPERRAGGPYGWLTPYLATIAASNAGVAARLLSLPRDELHFIAMALAFIGEARDDAATLRRFADALGRVNREAILRDFAPAVNPKLARFCVRLAGAPWRPASYRRLAELATESHALKMLRHSTAITRRDLLMLSRLPNAFRKRSVLKRARLRRTFRQLVFAIRVVRRIRTDLADRQIVWSLERHDSAIRYWVEDHSRRLPFPAPPTGVIVDGRGGELRPVVSGAELTKAASDYKNCAHSYIERAATGASVFYRCERDGKKIAFAEIRRVPGFGWAIDQIKAPSNRELGGAERGVILAAFEAAGIAAAPQAQSQFGWYDIE